MMPHKAVMLLAFIAMHSLLCEAVIQYAFSSPQYTIAEGETNNVMVMLERTGDPSELTTTTTVVINCVCPTECLTMPGANLAVEGTSASGADYSSSGKTLTFAPGITSLPVSINVHDDNDEELREYFCLSVEDPNVRGSQWSTTIIIPWNDQCIRHLSDYDQAGTADHTSPGYEIQEFYTGPFSYIGPWENTAGPITLKVTPQTSTETPGGTGDDINIFLTNIVNTFNDDSFAWYGIHIDDTEADHATHATAGGEGTFIVEGADGDTNPIGDNVLGTVVESNDIIDADRTTTFELSYDQGTTTLTRTSPSGFTLEETDASPLSINHLFVSASKNQYALWEICGMEPKKLPRVGAAASGFINKFGPEKAIDDVLSDTSCFFSEADSNGDNWMKIDLGREFDVRNVIIYPVLDRMATIISSTFNPDTLNNARVYVGSCRQDDITSNHVCDADIEMVSDIGNGNDQDNLIEVTCPPGTYGQYVYILPDNDATEFYLCDVTVFGDDVPIDQETKVYFTNEQQSVVEDVSTGDVTLSLTRTGSRRTCTYVDYYTDQTRGDFTAVQPSVAKEIKISGTDTQSDTVTVQITNDNICESTESFNVYLTNIVGGILDTRCSTTVEIEDDDAVTYSISTPATTNIDEDDGPLNIQVVRTGEGTSQDGSATLTFTDTAQNGATSYDYSNLATTLQFSSTTNSQTHAVSINDDECFEQSETFQVTLDRLTPAACSGVGAGLPLTMTITDNDSKFNWDIATDVILILEEGSGPRTIDIIREGTMQTKSLEFDVTYDTAQSNDFSITPSSSNSVTFPPGISSQPITITINDDDKVEGHEAFTLTLRDPKGDDCPNGNRGENYQLHIRIRDNDGVVNWENTACTAMESDGQCEVCLTRTGDLTDSQTVLISAVSNSALIGSDFTDIREIRFEEGDARVCVHVQITRDSIVESTETFTLTITPGQGIDIGSQHTTTVTIIDDDARDQVGWELPFYVFSEAVGSSATVYITHTGNNDISVSVTSSSGTATSVVDFTPVSTSFPIPQQTTRYRLQLQIINDGVDEPDESFVLTLRSDTDSVSVTQAQTTITITDDDQATTPPPTRPPRSLSGGAIAGIVIGSIIGALILAIVAGVLFWFCIRGRSALPVAGNMGVATPAPQPGQLQLVPLGYGGNAFGVPSNGFGYPYNSFGLPNNGSGYDNFYGNTAYGRNPYGFGYP
ncbi:uncharacterized protein [Amphiura filiformis]|uniref:uncharacterized protein isoform X2 n=1 Tax=Amphiura filiformis TaxID=82378 RepID=UPI003B2182AD